MLVPIVVFAACVLAKSWCMPLIPSEKSNDTLFVKEGTQKDVRIFVNHHFLQMNLDGIVNGSQTSDFGQTVWRRVAQTDGILLRSSLYCNYLCINECGYGYSALLPNNECLWTEHYDEYNNRFIFKKFGNKTAYLSVNMLGKLKRTVLLRKENLETNIEQSHIIVKEYDGPAVNVTCKPVNLIKIDYKPIKTCRNPPRMKKMKDKHDIEDATVIPPTSVTASEAPLSLSSIADLVNNKLGSIVPINLSTLDILNKTNIIRSNVVPVLVNEAIDVDDVSHNKTFGYDIDPNKTYYKEIINIKTLEKPVLNLTHIENASMTREVTEKTEMRSTEAIIQEIMNLSNTSTVNPDAYKKVFNIVKYTKTCSIYLI
jgi:hypothetical protein